MRDPRNWTRSRGRSPRSRSARPPRSGSSLVRTQRKRHKRRKASAAPSTCSGRTLRDLAPRGPARRRRRLLIRRRGGRVGTGQRDARRPALARRRGSDAARPPGQTPAFELVYERHARVAFSLAYRIGGHARRWPRTSCRRPSSRSGARGARYDRAPRLRPHLGARHRPQPRDRRAAARVRARAAGARATRASRSASRPRSARTWRPPAARRPRPSAQRARAPARGAVPGDRARLLRRLHPHRDRGDARDADGDGQGPHAARAREDAPRAGRRAGEPRMSTHDAIGPTRRAYVLGALAAGRARALRGAPRRLRGLPARGRRAAAWPPTRCRSACRRSRRRRSSRGGSWPSSRPRPSCCAAAGAGADAARPGAAAPGAAAGGRGRARARRGRASCSPAAAVAGVLLDGGERHARRSARTTQPPGAERELEVARRRRRSSWCAACRRRREGRIYQVWLKRAGRDRSRPPRSVVRARRRRPRSRCQARSTASRRCWSPTSRWAASRAPDRAPVIVGRQPA